MDSFIEDLKKAFEQRRQRNSAYSLRAFARDLGLYPATLSRVLAGTRNASPRLAKRIQVRLAEGKSSQSLLGE